MTLSPRRERAHAGGGRPPPPAPLLLPGTFGAPAALPFGPVRDAGDLGKIGSFARAEPIATRHVMSAPLFARGRAHAGGGRPPPPRGPHEIAVEGCGFHGVGPRGPHGIAVWGCGFRGVGPRGPHEIAGLHPPGFAGGARGCGFHGVGPDPPLLLLLLS